METVQTSKTHRGLKSGKRHVLSSKSGNSRAGDMKAIAASKDKPKPLAISHFEKVAVSTSSDNVVAPKATSTTEVATLVKAMKELELEKSTNEMKAEKRIRELEAANEKLALEKSAMEKKLKLENGLLVEEMGKVQRESNYSLTLHLSEKAKNDRLGNELVVAREELAGRSLTFEEKLELVAKAEGYKIMV